MQERVQFVDVCLEEFLIPVPPKVAAIALGKIMPARVRRHENFVEPLPRGCEREKLNDEFSSFPSQASESSSIGHRNRGVLLPRSVQSQRSPSRHSVQGVQSRDRLGSTTEAGALPRDYRGGPDSMIAFLLALPGMDCRGDKYLVQCSFSFSFSSLNAH